jgi:hypothetical protein
MNEHNQARSAFITKNLKNIKTEEDKVKAYWKSKIYRLSKLLKEEKDENKKGEISKEVKELEQKLQTFEDLINQ